jgi:hypothetical protein
MKDSMQSIRIRGINEGHPPTTREWNEFEARLDKRPIRFISNGLPKKGREMKPLPTVTDEQARANATRLLSVLSRLCREVSARGLLEDLVVAHAWCSGIKAIVDASEWTPPEAVAASEPEDGSDQQRESETTAAEATRNNATSPGA